MPQIRFDKTAAARTLRRATLASAGICLSVLLISTGSGPADAQRAPGATSPGEFQVAHYSRYRRSYRHRVQKKQQSTPSWFSEEDSKDPVQVIVSLPKQQLTVYKGDKALTTSRVSSGKRGYSTPAGVFSILEKKRHHYSNIYRGAPMPWMQRLTWSGIAFHGSNAVPRNRPASHGCVRLPPAFASQLFKFTERGAHVVVVNEENVEPVEISHPKLFQPEMIPPKDFDAEEMERAAKLNGINIEEEERSTKPVRILVTRRTGRELFMEMQQMLNDLQFNAGDVDGWMGPDTAKAIRRFQATYGMEKTGQMSRELIEMLYEVSGKGEPLNGHLYVRQNFKPVFDVPVLIKGGDKPLGSHMFTAMYFAPDDDDVRWLGVTLKKGSGRNAAYGRQVSRKKKDSDDVVLTETPPQPSTAEEALSRMEIPEDVRERISEMLTPGSSLAITNDGISRETTPKGTDFIVLMQ